jgi:hypothetical protein
MNFFESKQPKQEAVLQEGWSSAWFQKRRRSCLGYIGSSDLPFFCGSQKSGNNVLCGGGVMNKKCVAVLFLLTLFSCFANVPFGTVMALDLAIFGWATEPAAGFTHSCGS